MGLKRLERSIRRKVVNPVKKIASAGVGLAGSFGLLDPATAAIAGLVLGGGGGESDPAKRVGAAGDRWLGMAEGIDDEVLAGRRAALKGDPYNPAALGLDAASVAEREKRLFSPGRFAAAVAPGMESNAFRTDTAMADLQSDLAARGFTGAASAAPMATLGAQVRLQGEAVNAGLRSQAATQQEQAREAFRLAQDDLAQRMRVAGVQHRIGALDNLEATSARLAGQGINGLGGYGGIYETRRQERQGQEASVAGTLATLGNQIPEINKIKDKARDWFNARIGKRRKMGTGTPVVGRFQNQTSVTQESTGV